MQRDRANACRPQTAGFTLIEILVVLVIIGITLTFAALSLNPTGPSDRLNTAAERLLALTQYAANEAILSGGTIGLQLTGQGYDFVKLTDSGWQKITSTDSPLRPRTLETGVSIGRLNVDGQSENDGTTRAASLQLPASPIPPTPAQLAARQQSQSGSSSDEPLAIAIPAALFLASGELLPFRLTLSADGVSHRFEIAGSANGDIRMQRVQQ